MRFLKPIVFLSLLLVFAAGCNETSPVRPPDELAPPTNLTFITGEFTVDLTWARSPYESAGDFAGYNIYADTVSIAGLSDTTSAATLNARKVNSSVITARSYRVLNLGSGAPLVKGKKYYFHVRTVREDNRVSEASNEVNTAPRPEGDNDFQGDPTLWMHDFDAQADTWSGFGWNRTTGDGLGYATAQANQAAIDFFMIEEPNSSDDGSQFISPGQATFTSNWTIRHRTKFMDLGAGDTAWNTSVAPDTASMTTVVKVNADHTYALYTHEGYWAKIRVVTFQKNVTAAGTTNKLNRVKFDWAFQLVNNYGRFKPVPSPAR
jgi:hypothetical protein